MLPLLAVLLLFTEIGQAAGDWEKDLKKQVEGSTLLRIRSGGICHRQKGEEKTLLEITRKEDIAAFISLIKINPTESGFHCMCCGNPTLEFYKGKKLIASLGFHHGRSLRWAEGSWEGDGLLEQTSGQQLVQWMADRQVNGPKEEVEESRLQQEQSIKNYAKWNQAMPASIKPIFESSLDQFGDPDTEKLKKALAGQSPVPKERILLLLGWYGSGAGPWSGFPSYEQAPEKMLLEYRTEDIVSALSGTSLNQAVFEGAARFFADWSFHQKRPDDLKKLSPELKKKLLEHSLKSPIEDNRKRAENAFNKP